MGGTYIPKRMSGMVLQPQAIRALRRSLGLTQAAFGDRLGVTNVTVSRWEIGRIRAR